MGDWAPRALLTVLHVFAALASGGSLVAVLLQWAQNLACLPQIADSYGDPVSVLQENDVIQACDVITYASGVVCGLSLLMAITVNCCWGVWSCSCLHQFVTLLICVSSVGSGAALTVDFLLWCNTLQHTYPFSSGCESAANYYDEFHRVSNMTAYYRKMELQQGCQWAVVPVAFLTVLVYSIVMKQHARPQGAAVRIRGRYYVLQEDESVPLFHDNPTFNTSPPTYQQVTERGTSPATIRESPLHQDGGVNHPGPYAPPNSRLI